MSNEVEITKPDKIERVVGDQKLPQIITPTTVYPAPPISSVTLPCVNFFNAGNGYLGIRNNCGECKIAVVNWSGVGFHYYTVNPFSQIVVQMVSNYGELIGENPC